MLTRDQQLHENAVHLHDKARKCRELAGTAMTEEGRSVLFEIAQRYEEEASTADRPSRSRGLSGAPA